MAKYTHRAKSEKSEAIRKAIVLSLGQGSTRQSAYGAASISHDTFHRWLNKDSKFALAVLNAELKAVKSVEGALYKRAMGYEMEEERLTKTGAIVVLKKHYPPDTGSLVFFLCNRNPENWQNTQKVDHKVTGNLIVKKDF